MADLSAPDLKAEKFLAVRTFKLYSSGNLSGPARSHFTQKKATVVAYPPPNMVLAISLFHNRAENSSCEKGAHILQSLP